jgi:hypothetical protein
MGITVNEVRTTRVWDEQMLKSCLCPQDVEEVLGIRLSERDEDDFFCCMVLYMRSGIFTVKSAFKLALSIDQVAMGKVHSSSWADGGGGQIWSAKVPLKVCIFA